MKERNLVTVTVKVLTKQEPSELRKVVMDAVAATKPLSYDVGQQSHPVQLVAVGTEDRLAEIKHVMGFETLDGVSVSLNSK